MSALPKPTAQMANRLADAVGLEPHEVISQMARVRREHLVAQVRRLARSRDEDA